VSRSVPALPAASRVRPSPGAALCNTRWFHHLLAVPPFLRADFLSVLPRVRCFSCDLGNPLLVFPKRLRENLFFSLFSKEDSVFFFSPFFDWQPGRDFFFSPGVSCFFIPLHFFFPRPSGHTTPLRFFPVEHPFDWCATGLGMVTPSRYFEGLSLPRSPFLSEASLVQSFRNQVFSPPFFSSAADISSFSPMDELVPSSEYQQASLLDRDRPQDSREFVQAFVNFRGHFVSVFSSSACAPSDHPFALRPSIVRVTFSRFFALSLARQFFTRRIYAGKHLRGPGFFLP